MSTMTTKKSDSIFWLLWALAAALAWAIYLAVFLTGTVDDVARGSWLIGLLEGVLQWLVLRRVIQRAWLWAVLTAACGGLASLVYLLVNAPVPAYIFLFCIAAVAQWIVLGFSIRKAFLWIVVKLVAALITALLAIFPALMVLYDAAGDPLAWGIFGLAFGFIYGVLSAIGLNRLLRNPKVE